MFAATAAVILWQNAHLVVLWDLSYVLDTATRIALGQIPYKDFPLAHAPLTFLIQAAIIRLTGRVFFHHAIYAATVGGMGSVLSWRIVLHILRGRVAAAWAVSVFLTAPLTVLGLYCILPHPSYDCDCAFSILVALLLLLRLEPVSETGRQSPLACFFLAGIAVAIPVFFKQNMGLPFLAIACSVVVILIAARSVRRSGILAAGPGVTGLLALLAGAIATLAAAAVTIHFTAGIANYLHWTIGFAAHRRMPGLASMLGIYREPSLVWMLPCVALGLVMLSMKWKGGRLVGTAFLAAPFLWTLFTLYLYDDADERGDSLLALWPLLLILSAALTLWNLRRGLSLRALIPAIVLVAVNGTLMSQQLWGSTYAIWPLLIVLIAEMIAFVAEFKVAAPPAANSRTDAGCPRSRFWELGNHRPRSEYAVPILAVVISATLLICGGLYTASEERLSYAQFPEGPALHSVLPQLQGMSAPGDYIPNFEELLRFAAARIPRSDGLILIPGEDPFYFATGRVPQFPALLFDPATQPYSPSQLAQLAHERHIRWLIVKRALQIREDPTPQREATMSALLGEFSLETRLKGYDIYRSR